MNNETSKTTNGAAPMQARIRHQYAETRKTLPQYPAVAALAYARTKIGCEVSIEAQPSLVKTVPVIFANTVKRLIDAAIQKATT